jgi:chitosanase
MNLTDSQKRIIESVINCFETGSADGDYACISIYADGPHNIKQITYGRSQTTEYGNLRVLVARYVAAKGLCSAAMAPFADKVGSEPLTDNADFKALLRKAGKEDPVMRMIQDSFFDQVYFKPAVNWADKEGFTLPLSALVIYDSFIHSGSILWPIRQMFAESTPKSGGDEKAWISQYVNARNKWLENHSRPAVRSSAYRTKDLKKMVAAENWQLEKLPVIANGVKVK